MRAVLVGAPLRADGYVNSLVDLPGGAGSLKLRSGRLERAAEGRAWPVEPDWHVPVGAGEWKAVHDWLLAKELPEPPPLTEPEEVVDEDPDGEGFTSYVQRLEFIMTAADLYNVFNRFCATMHIKNPFENPTALAARISNDRAILEKADWEVVYPYKKIQGHNYWRFTKKYKT